MIVAGFGNHPARSKARAMASIDTGWIVLVACRSGFCWIAQIHIVEPAVEISNDVWMIKLSKCSQLAQKVINFRLTSN